MSPSDCSDIPRPESSRTGGGGQPPARSLIVALLIAVAVLVGWVQYPVLGVHSVWLDDESYVTKNPLVLNASWESAKRFLSEVQFPTTVAGYYQPLTMISLMLDSAAGGRADRLRPFHRTSLALHILNTMLIIVLLILLFGEPFTAAMIGLLFGVHPLTVEPLAWLSERKTLLAAFFVLGALIAYVRYAQTTVLDQGETRARARITRSRMSWYAATVVCYVLALVSKPTSTPLPILFLLLDYWPLRRLQPRAIVEKIPLFLLGLIAAAVTVLSQQSDVAVATVLYQQNGGTVPSAPSPQSILLALCHNIVFYPSKIFWPSHLLGYYLPPGPMSLANPTLWTGLIGTCILILVALVSLRWTPAVFAGWLFFLVALLPTTGVIQFTNTIASEKFAYLPSLGFLVILAWLLARCWSLGRGARHGIGSVQAAICVVVLVLAVAEAQATRRYLAIWQDDESHYSYVLSHSPQAWWLQYDFGDVLADQGRMEEAVSHYLAAEAGEPDDVDIVDIQQNLGNALFSLGRPDEAAVHYNKVLKLQPANVGVMTNLGLAYVQLGRSDEAIDMFRTVLRFNPTDVLANNELGRALAKQRDAEQAVAYYRAAVQSKPDFVEAHVNLADTLLAMGQLDEAIAQYRAALLLDPNDPAVHNNLAAALTERGLIDEAITHLRTALRLSPADQDVQANLREALARHGLSERETQ